VKPRSLGSIARCRQCFEKRFLVVDQASRISMHRMARKASTSAGISSMAKKINPVPTVADGLFAVFKVNGAHFFAPPASPTDFQDNFLPPVCERASDKRRLLPNIFMCLCSISHAISPVRPFEPFSSSPSDGLSRPADFVRILLL